MMILPLNLGKRSVLVIIIEPNNFERMKLGDPLTLMPKEQGGVLDIKNPENLEIVIAYEEDLQLLYEMAGRGDVAGVLKRISRGFRQIKGVDGVKAAAVNGTRH